MRSITNVCNLVVCAFVIHVCGLQSSLTVLEFLVLEVLECLKPGMFDVVVFPATSLSIYMSLN